MKHGQQTPVTPVATDSVSQRAENLALNFLQRVCGSKYDLDAIDELMTEDYVIFSGGRAIRGRSAFKAWGREFQEHLNDAVATSLDCFANVAGDRVVSH